MKKFGKFLVTTFSLAALIGGAYYFYQNVMNKGEDNLDDFEDFDDLDDLDDLDYADFDESEPSTDESDEKNEKATREYVTLNINAMKDTEEAAKEADQ